MTNYVMLRPNNKILLCAHTPEGAFSTYKKFKKGTDRLISDKCKKVLSHLEVDEPYVFGYGEMGMTEVGKFYCELAASGKISRDREFEHQLETAVGIGMER